MQNRSALVCTILVVLLLFSLPVSAQKALLLPSGGNTSAKLFNSEPFADSGAFTVGAGAFAAFTNPDATRYFIVSSSSITTVDASGATVSGSPLALGRPAMAAAITPDAGKLLVLTGSPTSNATLYVFNVAGGSPVQIGSARIDQIPLDVISSMNSNTAYVLTTSGLTGIDLTSSGLPVGDTLSLDGLAAPYSGVTQGPSGLLYVNGQNALYEIDCPALTVRHTISIAGFPAKPSFTTDNRALVANPGAASTADASLLIVDLSNSYSTVQKNYFGPTFTKLFRGGNGKYYGLSSSPRILYQTSETLSDLARASFAGQNVPTEVLDVFTTDEMPLTTDGPGGPHYLFAMTLTDLFRYDLTSTSEDPADVVKSLTYAIGVNSGRYVAPVSTKTVSGDRKSVV